MCLGALYDELTKALDLDLKVGDDVDLESKATKVEIGDNFAIIFDELENSDPFYVVICNKPLHRCEKTFDHEWGNIWYKGDMVLGGIWYYRVQGQRVGASISYRLLINVGPTFACSHLWWHPSSQCSLLPHERVNQGFQ
jgi:hypothetical protein